MNTYQEQPTTDISTPTTTPHPTTGSILASHREQAGLSVEYVATQLKLAKRQIEALEQDRFDALPGNTFVRGFVRNYARLLQIDPQPLLNDLARSLPAEAPQAALPRLQDEAMPILRPGRPSKFGPSALFVVIGIVLALGGVAAWYYLNGRHEPQLTVNVNSTSMGEQSHPMQPTALPVEPSPAVTAEQGSATPGNAPSPTPAAVVTPTAAPSAAAESTTPVPVAAAPAAPAPVATSTAAPQVQATTPTGPAAVEQVASAEIRLVAKEDSWVQITDASGKKLLSELVRAGDSRSVAAGTPPYQVRVGNGRHTELYFKGRQVDLIPHVKVDVATLELK